MSELGQKQTFSPTLPYVRAAPESGHLQTSPTVRPMSALPSKADVCRANQEVR